MRQQARCGCKPVRIFNMTNTIVRKLDDLAAGVLFGDSDQNMLKLSDASPGIMQTISKLADGLDRYVIRCSNSGGHGTTRTAARRTVEEAAVPPVVRRLEETGESRAWRQP